MNNLNKHVIVDGLKDRWRRGQGHFATTRPDHLSSTSRPHMVERSDSNRLSSDLDTCTVFHVCTHVHNKCSETETPLCALEPPPWHPFGGRRDKGALTVALLLPRVLLPRVLLLLGWVALLRRRSLVSVLLLAVLWVPYRRTERGGQSTEKSAQGLGVSLSDAQPTIQQWMKCHTDF